MFELDKAPNQPEYRGPVAFPPRPAPKLTWAEMVAEMAENDEEFRAWQEAEARAELFARGPRPIDDDLDAGVASIAS